MPPTAVDRASCYLGTAVADLRLAEGRRRSKDRGGTRSKELCGCRDADAAEFSVFAPTAPLIGPLGAFLELESREDWDDFFLDPE